MNDSPVMIRPHKGKFDFIHILCLQETFVETTIQKRTIFVHIPVENKTIDTIFRSRFNLLCHHLRIFFVRICLLYTSDAADEEDSVDLGGRRIIKKKKKK